MTIAFDSRQAQLVTIGGKTLMIFCSNDYLGLSHHPEVIEASSRAAKQYGCGTGGAPGTSGTTALHFELESRIAAFKHREKAMVFPSGYAANVSLHQSLDGPDTVFFSDQKNHPSATDGIRLSGSDKQIFPHLGLEKLEELVSADSHARKIVTTCSVFTVDGAITALDELARLKQKYGFILVLDEAHATGCIGESGRGLEEMYALYGAADLIMGTFSKALGSQGGFLAYSADSEKLLAQPLRGHEYSTSIAAPSAAASLKALDILEREPFLVGRMREHVGRIYDSLAAKGLSLNPSGRHILNVYFETEDQTRLVIAELFERGYYVVPINLDGRWGIRVTAMAVHRDDEINGFCRALEEIRKNKNPVKGNSCCPDK